MSAGTRGRPGEGRAQYSRKRRRCQRTTGVGTDDHDACFESVHTRARPTQKNRSVVRSFGRLTVRRYTASWWRQREILESGEAMTAEEEGKRRSIESSAVFLERGL
jgi:hypothetical protein